MTTTTNYVVGQRVKRYDVRIEDDPFGDGVLDDLEAVKVYRWDTNPGHVDYQGKLRGAALDTRGNGVRFLLARGRAGYSQGDYGVKLATSWTDRIIGVAVLDPAYLDRSSEAQKRKYATGWLDTWSNAYLGDVYGIIVTDEAGKEVDACWGYIGTENAQRMAKHEFKQWNPTAEVPEMIEMV